jgi:serpin B
MSKKYFVLGLIALIIVGVLVGCSQQSTISVDDSKSTPEGIAAVVDANNQFAFDLYSEFKEEEGNVFFSPYSISTALAMTYEGARGKTAEEIQSVLHIPKDAGVRQPNIAAIYNDLNNGDAAYKLSTANALWAQQDYPFLEEYTNTVGQYYGGRVTNLDFVGAHEQSRQIINTFIEENTNDKIKDLIPQGVLNANTRLVLTNAIYFKGTWVKQFDKKDTRDEDFTTLSGEKIKVPMMRLTGDDAEFNYAETDDVQLLEMSYDGEDLSMLIILPKNDVEYVESFIHPNRLAEWRSMLREQRVDIFIPKFTFETKYFMAKTLSDMGMPSAFDNADFSGMDGTKQLSIAAVIHQAFVDVNEEGTEAAAATGVVMGIESVGPRIPVFRADHPFIFIIQQKETGNILFMGKVANPSE